MPTTSVLSSGEHMEAPKLKRLYTVGTLAHKKNPSRHSRTTAEPNIRSELIGRWLRERRCLVFGVEFFYFLLRSSADRSDRSSHVPTLNHAE